MSDTVLCKGCGALSYNTYCPECSGNAVRFLDRLLEAILGNSNYALHKRVMEAGEQVRKWRQGRSTQFTPSDKKKLLRAEIARMRGEYPKRVAGGKMLKRTAEINIMTMEDILQDYVHVCPDSEAEQEELF